MGTILTERKKWQRTPSPFQKLRKSHSALTDQEQANVRAALSKLVRVHGSFKRLRGVMGVSIHGLMKARSPSRPQSVRLALVVARIAGCSVDDILKGAWEPPPVPCPRCNGCGYVPA